MDTTFISKPWGMEKIFVNNDLYCGKEIFVKYGEWSSNGNYHYHKIKDETFYVIKGILKLDYVLDNNYFRSILLRKCDTFHVPPGMKHRFTSLADKGCTFIEVSTTDREDDSYRVKWENDEWRPVNG